MPAPAALAVRIEPRWGLRPGHVKTLRAWGQAWARIDTPALHAAIARHQAVDVAGGPACSCPEWSQLSEHERLDVPPSPIRSLADLVERDWPADTTASALHHY